MPATRRVLITGANGDIGRILAERLAADYDLVLTDADTEGELELSALDIRDVEALTAHLAGVDTVVHLAGAASPDSDWGSVLDLNIVGTRNVLEAARQSGVRRVVLASSNHAMGMYDRYQQWPVYGHLPPRPDSLYGVSKVFGEVIGRFYHEEHGLDVIALRIGWSSGDPTLTEAAVVRAMWLSPADTAAVVTCAIEAPVRFGVYYAVSDNPDRRWDITDTMLDLGFRPSDSWLDVVDHEENVVPGGAPSSKNWPHLD